MKTGSRRLGLVCVALATLAAPASAANIYRWVDEQGRLRFTDSPASIPAAQLHRTVPVEPGPASDRRVQRHGEAPTGRRSGALIVPFERDGRLMRVQLKLNGWLEVPAIIDTAASFGVTLPAEVARSLDRNPRKRRTVQAITANGVTDLELISVSSVTLGGSRVNDLEGIVNPNLEVALLGAEFLNRFDYSVRSSENVIILEPLRD